MLKKLFKLIKKNEASDDSDQQVKKDSDSQPIPVDNDEPLEQELPSSEVIEVKTNEIEIINNDDEGREEYKIVTEIQNEINEEEINEEEITEEEITDIKADDIKQEQSEILFSDSEKEFINDIKIKRGMSIRSIDIYTKEEQIFSTHKECSKKLKIPLGYIKENLKYGYTDYLGDAIMYLSQELKIGERDANNYLNASKSPIEIYNTLNNKIFSSRISETKRDAILSNDKIEPIKMHYSFECLDKEYNDYFIKYKSIIQRGGKKKIELVDKKGEVFEIFKSLEECSNYLNKDKAHIVDMLKHGDTKIGRYEIRYSLRNI